MGVFQAPTKTAKDVGDYVKRAFGDESGVQITDTDIIRWINSAQNEIVSDNSPLKATASITLTPGQYQYTLGTNIHIQYITSIQVDGVKMRYMSFQDAETFITDADPTHTNVAAPQLWYEWGGVLFLYPVPDQARTLTVFYTQTPTPVATVTDTLALPDNYFNRIVEYVMAQAYELDENQAGIQLKLSQFDSNLLKMQGNEDMNDYETYPLITIMPEDV